ncbi:MAG: GNAT family N-acetyltransferase [Pseudomonadota bacterium]
MQPDKDEIFRTDRLILRNWRDAEPDHEACYRLNSDPTVMEYFPFRRSRAESAEKLIQFKGEIDKIGYCLAPVVEIETGQIAGMTGLMDIHFARPFDAQVEIGWRFLPEFWGKGYASESATGWLNWGFKKLGVPEIVAFAIEENTGSTNVMKRIGMEPHPVREFDHPQVGEEHPNLIRHVLYRITRRQWVELN